MDWSRAKNIFIIIFLAVNLFLLANIFSFKMGEGISRETISDAVQILEARGVVLECKIPDRTVKTASLQFSSTPLDKAIISGILMGKPSTESMSVSGSKKLNFDPANYSFTYTDNDPQGKVSPLNANEAEKYIKKVIKDTGMPAAAFTADAFSTNNDGSVSLRLVQKFNGILIINNTMEATLTENGITALKCRYRRVGEGKDTKNVLPAYLVLLRSFEENNKSTITAMELGFGEYQDRDTKEPYNGYIWRVKIKEAPKPRIFRAIDGREIEM
jgi:regulatory protein YycI of two-component signal transduction system YycFG